MSTSTHIRAIPAAIAAVIGTASVPAIAHGTASSALPERPPAKSSRSITYEVGFFSQFAARTAYDVVQRIPGFTIDLGSNEAANGVDVRGFAGTAGNVVINGARPSSKSETLDTLLSRIPASRVVRVDVGPGDLYGSDYAGKTQVANLILSGGGGATANVEGSIIRHWMGKLTISGKGSVSFSSGPSTFNLSADTGRTDYYEKGYDRVSSLPSGTQLEYRRKFNRIHPHDPYVSGSWALDGDNDRAAHLNLRFAPSTFRLRQSNHVTPTGDAERDDQLIQDYKTRTFEISGDVTRPLAHGALKMVALANRQHRERYDQYDRRSLGAIEVIGGFQDETRAQRDETIGRVTWTRQKLLGMRFEMGGEFALNTLDYAFGLFDVGPGGGRTRIELPIENAKVNETRGEVWINAGRPLTNKLRVDGGLNYEFSHLKVTGDAAADRKLRFIKPSVTFDWQAPLGWHAQFILRRTIAQLDFFDFVSSAELSVNRVNGGNADLQPQRSWESRFFVERPVQGKGQNRFEIGYDFVGMLQDRILILDADGSAFDAPGNLGNGRRIYAEAMFDAPLGRLWKGLHAKVTGKLQRTRVDDPITGRPRDWSGFYPRWSWNADIRRDAGRFAYGVSIEDRARTTFFRTDGVDVNYNQGLPYTSAFIEYRPTVNQKLTLNLEDLSNTGGARNIFVYLPDRRSTDPSLLEHRFRNSHVRIGLTFKQSIGGNGSATTPH
jgi:hypothetical protein